MFWFWAIIWILGTLLFASLWAVVAERRGVEYVIALVSALIIIANVLATKVITFLWWAVPAGFIVYSTTFLLTDIISEFYGKKAAARAVWCGLFADVIYIFSLFVVLHWDPAVFWDKQIAFSSVLGLSLRITVASLLAYVISQFHDVYAYHLLKRLTGGKHLWLRNTLSTSVSQLLDTVIFISVAFYGVFPLAPMIIGQYLVKLFVAVLDTPFLYGVRYFYSRKAICSRRTLLRLR